MEQLLRWLFEKLGWFMEQMLSWKIFGDFLLLVKILLVVLLSILEVFVDIIMLKIEKIEKDMKLVFMKIELNVLIIILEN